MSTFKDNSAIQNQDWNVASSVQNENLGAYQTLGDGRVFRYAWDGGTALAPGKLYQSAAQNANNWKGLGVIQSYAVGATSVGVGSNNFTLVANALADGIMVTSKGPGSGYAYGISSNTGVSGATNATLTLSDGLVTALTASSQVDVRPNTYSAIIINPTTISSSPVGVAVIGTAGSQYSWIQTHGQAAVLVDGNVKAGDQLVPSVNVAGAVSTVSTTNAMIIGTALSNGSDTNYVSVFLNIN